MGDVETMYVEYLYLLVMQIAAYLNRHTLPFLNKAVGYAVAAIGTYLRITALE